ncbi:PBP1A family penicillin-binding protein [Bacillaceae bacterium S4-13-56]
MLRKMKWKKWAKGTALAGILFFGLGVIGLGSIYFYAYLQGEPSLIESNNTLIYDSKDQVIGVIRGDENRYWVPLEEIPNFIIDATIEVEDQHFYTHNGFDFKRIAGAVIADIKAMSKAQGASTITQQYARNLYLNHEKTWKRKLNEALYALRLEMFYDKDTILEGYLNTIFYGHGAYGIEAAAQTYFHKSVEELSPAEGFFLVGIPKGPTRYSPYNNFELAKNRQQHIINIMEDRGFLTKTESLLTKREVLDLKERGTTSIPSVAPYFQDLVIRELGKKLNLTREDIKGGGFRIYTTLNVEHQAAMEEEVENTINTNSDIQIASLAVNPKTGAISALIGGRDFDKSPFNRVVQAKRMPGSSFKPFLYYAALENGYAPNTMLQSRPTEFELADGTVYQPSNFNGYYADAPITLATALALSDNIYAVKTNLFLGPEKVANTAERFGIHGPIPANASLALGTYSVAPIEMAGAYSLLANKGIPTSPYTIRKVTDTDGNVIYEHEDKKKKPVLDKKLAFVLSHLMTGMFDEQLNGYMRVTGASIAPELTRQYAGKSGTTRSDSWMVGFSPSLVTAVWTGYDDNRHLEKTEEHSYSKKIWAGFMEAAHEGQPYELFKAPDGVKGVYIDPHSGQLATPYCPAQRLTYFVQGTEPTEYCTDHMPDGSEETEEPEQEKEKSRWRSIIDWIF